jgi:hypothetical protein
LKLRLYIYSIERKKREILKRKKIFTKRKQEQKNINLRRIWRRVNGKKVGFKFL